MNVGIIGHGYVGSAVAHSHSSDQVLIRDPKLGSNSAPMSDIAACDVIYICVPSPSIQTGQCDISILDQTLHELYQHVGSPDALIICKTTAPPLYYREVNRVYQNIVHVPEFLTAHNHIESYMSSQYFVIGGHSYMHARTKELLQSIFDLPDDRWHFTDSATAAFYKYMVNSFLATKLSFMNECFSICRQMDIQYDRVIELARFETRLGDSHMQVPGPDGLRGWGGACFPKDVAAFEYMANQLGVGYHLLEYVQRLNQHHRDLE